MKIRAGVRMLRVTVPTIIGLSVLTTSVYGLTTLMSQVEQNHSPAAEHQEQWDLFQLVKGGESSQAFEKAFELGDELFESSFNMLDGVGANVGDGQRFTRVPRADLTEPEAWGNHFPARETGPNGQACNQCHDLPVDDGAGATNSNVYRDPEHSGVMSQFIARNTSHIFAPGALQRLAEEMTEELLGKKAEAVEQACARNKTVKKEMKAKRVSFGQLLVNPISTQPCEVEFDTSALSGINDDLIVRPFQWKGIEATLRSFNRGASHNELGMQAVELVGNNVDGDFDGVTNELTVGDMTALTIYLAAQPRPTTKLELSYLGLIEPLSKKEKRSIKKGKKLFAAAGCVSCHKPRMLINDPVFSEPSQSKSYQEAKFPAGQNPRDEFVDPDYPISFDLTFDQPDNIVTDPRGNEYRLGALQKNQLGYGVVRLYGDLKRHDMGPLLAENVDEKGVSRSTWMTKELWGVGSTPPYLHDGRATTLTEAILLHGGESLKSRDRFVKFSPAQQEHVINFLNNLVLFKQEEEE